MDRFESRMTPEFLAEWEMGMLLELRVIEREKVEDFKEGEKGKRRASVLSSFSLSWFSVIHVLRRLCMQWVLWWGWSLHWEERISGAVCQPPKADGLQSGQLWYRRERERGVVYRTKRTGPSTEPWGAPYMSCDGEEDELLTEVDWYLSEIWLKPLECSGLNAQNRVSKAAEISNKRRTEMLSLSRAERISVTVRN